ncbi:MAG: hypothetical protein R2745_11150 [Vicinamibacterales bacterium]
MSCRAACWDSWHFDKEPSIFDAITTAVSIVGVLLIYSQWKQTERALEIAESSLQDTRDSRAKDEAAEKEARRIASETRAVERADADERSQRDERMVAANELTAKAARDTINVQREVQQSELRPWVRVERGEITRIVAGQNPFCYLRVVNTGRTRAINLRIHKAVRQTLLLREAYRGPLFDGIPEPLTDAEVLNPGITATFVLVGNEPVDDLFIEELNSKIPHIGPPRPLQDVQGIGLVVVGEILYEDVFNQSHRTRFCVYMDNTLQTKLCPENNFTE